MPPPIINLTVPITMTTMLMVDPLLALLNKPGTKPSTPNGMTTQFSHPSNGMKPTNPIARARIPIMTEMTFIEIKHTESINFVKDTGRKGCSTL